MSESPKIIPNKMEVMPMGRRRGDVTRLLCGLEHPAGISEKGFPSALIPPNYPFRASSKSIV